jgi:hypothetical protein
MMVRRCSRRLLALSAALLALLAACTGGREAPEAEPRRPRIEASSLPCRGIDDLIVRVKRGYVPRLSPDISLIPREPNYVGSASGPVHSGPWNYLAEVPFVVYGPGVVRPAGEVRAPATLADAAPTTARLLGFNDFPRRDGRVLPKLDISSRPRLVVTIVWDGGGWNVLHEHGGRWPYLKELMQNGTSYTHMTIGSSPSVTPSIHTTLSTGAFPRRHGIPGLRMRSGDEYVDPFLGLDASHIRIPTLGDLYDRSLRNRPIVGMTAAVNWHLGMVGHGAAFPRGDADPAPLLNEDGELFTNTSNYSLPDIGDPAALERGTRALDATDGKVDGTWSGHDLADPSVRYSSPAHVAYQEFILERLVVEEGFGADRIPDLLYVNLKSGDDAGHKWGMTSDEDGKVFAAEDDALRRFVRVLDRQVGKGRWALLLTADHGQTPYPDESGAWPIGGAELARDTNVHFDHNDNDIDLADRVTSPGMYVNAQELKSNGVTLAEVARWIADYTVGENLKEGDELPASFGTRAAQPLFDATLAGPRVAAITCARAA